MNPKTIKVVVFDSIGVLFSSTVLFDAEKGETLRTRSHVDGQGISFLRAAGIRVVFMSASDDGFIRTLEKRLNGLPSVANGSWAPIPVFAGITGQAKADTLGAWLEENNLSWSECAYMGDDIGDWQAMQKAGFRAAPASAEEMIKKDAHFVASRTGGAGAVRDLCNHILEAQEVDVTTLALK